VTSELELWRRLGKGPVMLFEGNESPLEAELANRGPAHLAPSAGGSLHDDVERLIAVAGELFTAIEAHVHQIDEELSFAVRENVMPSAQTVFKEKLLRTAARLNESLHEVAVHLEGRDAEAKYGRRQGDRRAADTV
jgi:hypothetical protein